MFDTKTQGYFNGQTLVVALLVSEAITIPVGFAFYRPDPAIQAWEKQEKQLKKQEVPKSQRPERPERAPEYPTKMVLAKALFEKFVQYHPQVQVSAVLGDNHYSKGSYMDEVGTSLQTQVISQLKSNQKVRFRGKEIAVQEFFRRYFPTEQTLVIRGEKAEEVWMGSARLFVPSHKAKRLIIAIKYEGEENYRYVVASDLSWRSMDVLETFTLRWLVEVFFEDFKSYEGWGQLAKQPGVEGSVRGLSLSLLLDHCLLLHPSQEARFENKLPAATVGSLLQKSRAEVFFEFLKPFVTSKEHAPQFAEFGESIERIFELRPSKKHMSGRTLGRQEPTPSLRYRALQRAA